MDWLKNFDILVAVYFVVPGFIGLKIYAALRPIERLLLKDTILEMVTFSAINFILVGWTADYVRETYVGEGAPLKRSLILLGAFVIAPAIMALAFHLIWAYLEKTGVVLNRHKNGWDAFFSKRQPCWITVHLKDGRRIGGLFSSKSFAGLYPDSGHLYLEEVWKLSDDGVFESRVDRTQGLIIRPDEWSLVEIFSDEGG